MKLIKYLTDNNLGSRRACHLYIVNERIKVNDTIELRPSREIDPSEDKIEFDDKKLKPPKTEYYYILMNKPEKTICTKSDKSKRTTVYDLIHHKYLSKANIATIGRLDFKTKGLLLLTNDGDTANKIIHPKYKIKKIYQVEIKGTLKDDIITLMKRGIVMDKERLKFYDVQVVKPSFKTSIIEVTLTEGKNREIRRMFAFFKIKIKKLTRIAIGDLYLKNIKEGDYKLIKKRVIDTLILNSEKSKK